MSDMNRVDFRGRLGATPEVRMMDSGKAVASLRIATNVKGKDKDRTIWHRVSLFGAHAVYASKHCSVGDTVAIEGYLDYRTWKNKENVEVTTAEVLVNESNFNGFSLIRKATDKVTTENDELSPPIDIP